MSHELKLRWPDDSVPDTEINLDFVQKMANRMVQSYHKRGPFRETVTVSHCDLIAQMKERLSLYEQTGNTEWLVDIGNQSMIEFTQPSHPSAHFRATSSYESPGLPTKGGERIR